MLNQRLVGDGVREAVPSGTVNRLNGRRNSQIGICTIVRRIEAVAACSDSAGSAGSAGPGNGAG